MKDRLFLDTNVMLDLLGERAPFFATAARIATLADKGKIELVVSAVSYATVYYLLSKYENTEAVMGKLRKFRSISSVSDLSETVIDKGLSSNFSDFEDALQYHCALHTNCNIIITRNGKDFRFSELPVLTGEEYLKNHEP
ncbi:MAG: PIN domain-containing protein [Flavobacteriales bacterium]|nr:PIN domain-containing protein [Flavobacteriales bacterium]